ncbi:MAG: phenylacetic acid degradation protein PaaN [Pseudomonas sp.]|nr:phenylacetic acid degradation protein PaaN [Pseudomonas sp.]HBS77183.1 phenylacetic acid degradation protein PaaN [Pseudomonas sp.]
MPVNVHSDPIHLFNSHRERLNASVRALAERGHWSAYEENFKHYPDADLKGAQASFEALLNKRFELCGPRAVAQVGDELSPYGMRLGVTYDQYDLEELMARQQSALPGWRDVGQDGRVGVCIEILERLNALSPIMAHAVMHTTGQGYPMAFQAGAAHAQDRGLEAVACAWRAMGEIPGTASYIKQQGKQPPQVLNKRWHIVPRGLSLVIACSTFPTWNTYPGLFSSLATGNPVMIKAHPAAILPVAMTVRVAQDVLSEAGLDPMLVCLVVDTPQEPVAQTLAVDPRVKLVDFTGSSSFGNWLELNAKQAQVFTEKAGVNAIVLDSVQDLEAVASNLAFSLSLYSGQMCTTPQLILVPYDGIGHGADRLTFDQVTDALATAVKGLLSDNERACAVLGAIQSPATLARIEACRTLGKVLLDSEALTHPGYPDASIRTPLLLEVDADQQASYAEERFGPIAFVVATENSAHSLQLARDLISTKGALTLGVYSQDSAYLDQAEVLAQEVAVALSINLDSSIYVNQSAAFSDYHGTGGNPAANASFTDGAFVSRRFVVVQSRRPATAWESADELL